MRSGNVYNGIYTTKYAEGSMLKDANFVFGAGAVKLPPQRRALRG